MLPKTEEKKLDPRIKRTRHLLQAALFELMAEKSFHAITVQDIAARATLNRVTFYVHFADKYALLEYAVRQMFAERLRSQIPESASFSPQNLARLIQTVCEFLAEIGGHCPPPRGQWEPLMEKQIKAELHAVLSAWLAQDPAGGGPSETLDLAAMVVSWAIYGAAVQWNQKKPAEPAADFARRTLPMILAALQPAVGVRG